jgi:hypothetical protein
MKLDKLANSKQMRRASKLFTHASKLASIGDEDGFDGGEECETQYEEEDEEECAPVYESAAASEPYAYEQQYMDSYQQQTTTAEPVYEQAGPVPPSYPPDAVAQSQVDEQAPQYQYYETPPTCPSNTYVTEPSLCSETNTEQTYVGSTQSTVPANENNFAYTEPPAMYAELSTNPVYETVQPPPPAEAIPPYMPPDATCLSEPQPTGALQDGSVPPLVFEPILAGPMMVSPPAEQNGVVFAPTDVSQLI